MSACRSPTLPEQYLPLFKESVKKAGLKWEDFKVTDNLCGPHPEPKGLLAKVSTQPGSGQVLLRLSLDWTCSPRGHQQTLSCMQGARSSSSRL